MAIHKKWISGVLTLLIGAPPITPVITIVGAIHYGEAQWPHGKLSSSQVFTRRIPDVCSSMVCQENARDFGHHILYNV